MLLEFEGQEGFLLRPEMTARVLLRLEERVDVLTLPRNAIKHKLGKQFVTVQRDRLWAKQEIEAGWRTDSRVEVCAGLDEGERVQINLE